MRRSRRRGRRSQESGDGSSRRVNLRLAGYCCLIAGHCFFFGGALAVVVRRRVSRRRRAGRLDMLASAT